MADNRSLLRSPKKKQETTSECPFSPTPPSVKPSVWGFNWASPSSTPEMPANDRVAPSINGEVTSPPPPPPPLPENGFTQNWREQNKDNQRPETPTDPLCQFSNLPAALYNTLKKDKKPFTYTPSGLDLSEIRSKKMQKRLAANRKLATENGSSGHANDSGGETQIRVLPVYNSPINMYSEENAMEALEIQTGMKTRPTRSPDGDNALARNYVTDSYDEPKTAIQSKSFRVLQAMTSTVNEDAESKEFAKARSEDEMRFRGIKQNVIPSRFFRNLQKITRSEEVDAPIQESQAGYSSIYQAPKRPHIKPPPNASPSVPAPPQVPLVSQVEKLMSYSTPPQYSPQPLQRPSAFLRTGFESNYSGSPRNSGYFNPREGTDF